MKRLDIPDEYRTPGVAARVVNLIHLPTGLTINLMQHESGEDAEFSELRVGLFSADCVNPTATTLVALADALGLEVIARRRA